MQCGNMKLALILMLLLLPYPSFAQQNDCDYKVEILLNDSEFSPENFSWRMKATKLEGPSTNITSSAKIEDMQGNLIKGYKPFTSEPISRQKTSGKYSPNLKPNEYKITANIYVTCNDVDKNNDVDLRLIKIIEESEQSKQQNDQNKITANNNIENNNDNSENPSKNTSTNNIQQIDEKQNNETEQIKQDPNYEEDNIIHLKKEANNQNNLITSDVISQPEIVYKSSSQKTKELILYFLLGLSVLLNIILIWRR